MRKHSVVVGVVAGAAVLLLAGGAVAATHYLITDIHQIKPSVVKQLRGERGWRGWRGWRGETGARGPEGPKGPQGPQGPQGPKGDNRPQGQQVGYEVDNGSSWALAAMPLALAKAGSYEDAGIVVDLGPASSFKGITKSGTSNLKDNVWITDGDQAFSPGMHPLSSAANFTYGTGNPDGTWYMMTGTYKGQNLTSAQIAHDYAGYEAYGWVGITGDGTSSSTGHVSSVNGKDVNADLVVDSTTARASGS